MKRSCNAQFQMYNMSRPLISIDRHLGEKNKGVEREQKSCKMLSQFCSSSQARMHFSSTTKNLWTQDFYNGY